MTRVEPARPIPVSSASVTIAFRNFSCIDRKKCTKIPISGASVTENLVS